MLREQKVYNTCIEVISEKLAPFAWFLPIHKEYANKIPKCVCPYVFKIEII